MSAASASRGRESGMLLIEALVAMLIVAMVTIAYIGIRSTALISRASRQLRARVASINAVLRMPM